MNAQPHTWPSLLTELLAGHDLGADQTAWAMDQVMSGLTPEAALAGLLVALRAKGETVTELRALADGMLEHAHRFEVKTPAVDIVGTGGDRSHTVNISTMASLVVAGAGVPVVKHGNRAASSSSGSADVLGALGVRLDLTPARVAEVFAEVGITFCFAQTFHPAFRHAAVVRRDLGIPTAFNVLGPLTNPAQPGYAAVGVADPRMAPVIAGVFADRGRYAAVFRGDDGLDELSPATTSTLWWVNPGEVQEFSFDPRAVGVPEYTVADLRGGAAEANAQVARRLLAGDGGAVRDVVVLNAAMALAVVATGQQGRRIDDLDGVYQAVTAGIDRAGAAIDDGSAEGLLSRWVAATQKSSDR